MKKLSTIAKYRVSLLLLALSLLLILSTSVASAAEPPKDYHFALSACAGLPVADVQAYQQKFDTLYGWRHQLDSPAKWDNTYIARANEFSATLGCQPVIGADNQTTFWVRIYAGWFAFYNGARPQPE